MANPRQTFTLVERELVKFGSYDNVKHVLSKYMVEGVNDQETIERLLVILVKEFRLVIEKMSSKLPTDEAEAEAIVERKATRKATAKRGRPKKSAGPVKVKSVDIDFDSLPED